MSNTDIIRNKQQCQEYILFDCPKCGAKRKAYKYDNSNWARCNKGSCDWTHNFAVEKKFKKILNFIPIQKFDDVKDRTKSTKEALGKVVSQTEVYLNGRIPGCDVEELAKQKIIGVSSYVKEGASKRWDRLNYRLFTPLLNISSGKVITGQHRYTGLGSPPLDKKGDPRPKNVSMSGSYGSGVTFGSLPLAIRCAASMSMPTIYITEGDMDFLTMRSIGFKTCVSVPGAAQAKKIGVFLKDQGWCGKIVCCLDNDAAGSKATKDFLSGLDGYGDIVVEDASPGLEGHDITDYNKKFGQEFTQRMVENGDVIYNKSGMNLEFLENEKIQQVFSDGIWSKKLQCPSAVNNRVKNVVDLTGGKSSPIKKLIRSINCGQIKQTELFYDVDGPHLENFIKKRCQSKWCPHCRSVQWNFSIAPSLLENWPDRIMVGQYSFDDYEDFAKKKQLILSGFRPSTEMRIQSESDLDGLGKSLCLLVNVIEKKLLIFVDADNLDSMTQGVYGFNPVTMEKKDALRNHVLPAYNSPIEYMIEKCSDPSYPIHEDPWIYKKTKSVISRSGMPWPSQDQIRSDVSVFFKELREKEVEEPTDSEENQRFVINYTKEDALNIISVSQRSFSYKSLSDSIMWNESIKTNPVDPTINYIAHPNSCPKDIDHVLKDFIELHERIPIDHATYSIHLRSKKKKQQKKLIEMSEREYKDYLLWLNEREFNPTKYQTMSFKYPIPPPQT